MFGMFPRRPEISAAEFYSIALILRRLKDELGNLENPNRVFLSYPDLISLHRFDESTLQDVMGIAVQETSKGKFSKERTSSLLVIIDQGSFLQFIEQYGWEVPDELFVGPGPYN